MTCLKCKKKTKYRKCRFKRFRSILLSKCAVCSSKKSTFMKEQEAKGLLSSLGLKIPLSKIPLLGDILF